MDKQEQLGYYILFYLQQYQNQIMLKPQITTKSKKESSNIERCRSKALSKISHSQNTSEYEKLTFSQIQSITRAMIKDPKTYQKNIGVISSIKGKMYCLKLGEVSSSKDFSHYFYFTRFRKQLQKGEPLGKLNTNSMFNTTIQRF